MPGFGRWSGVKSFKGSSSVPTRKRLPRRRLLLVPLVGCLAAFAMPSAAGAGTFTDLKIDHPANGAVFNAAPTQIDGTMDSGSVSLDAILDIRMTVKQQLRDGTLAAPTPVYYRKVCTLGCNLFGQYDWSWTDAEDDFFQASLQQLGTIPTADGQWRVQAFQPNSDNTATMEADATYTIDSMPPDTSVDSGPTFPTTSTDAAFVFSGVDPDPPNGFGSGIDYFNCRLDSSNVNDWDHCTDPGGSAPYTYDLHNVSEGGHTLEVKAIDKANNEDPTPASYSWVR